MSVKEHDHAQIVNLGMVKKNLISRANRKLEGNNFDYQTECFC